MSKVFHKILNKWNFVFSLTLNVNMADYIIYNEKGFWKRTEAGISLWFIFANNNMVHIGMLKSTYQEKILNQLKGTRRNKIYENLDEFELRQFETDFCYGSYDGFLAKLLYRLCERHIILKLHGEKRSKTLPIHVFIEPQP